MARHTPNPWLGVNYLDRDNKMAVPPAYWLQRLYDFDNDLVVFPSIKVPFAYVLARKARRTGGMNLKDPSFAGATDDTKFCLTHHLLPVSLIYRQGGAWTIDNILADLRRRDIWTAGGGDKFADRADANDEADEAKTQAEVRNDMWNRSGDGWRSYQARTGQRSKVHYGHRKANGTA